MTRVADLDVKEATLELSEPFAIAGGAPTTAEVVYVRLRLDDGATGLGEAAPFTAVSGETQASTAAALRRARDAILGAPVGGARALAAAARVVLGGAPAALAAFEQATFDAMARRAGVSLRELFGGAEGTTLETDVTITAGTRAHAEESAARFFGRGFRTFKIKCGATSPEEDCARIACVARRTEGARYLVDANGGYTADEALELLARLDAEGIALGLYEQPVHRRDVEGMARVTRASRVPVCADESVRTPEDALSVVRLGLASAINVKIMKSGLIDALGIWHVARAAGLELMIGGMVESPMAMSCSAHFALGLGGFAHVDLDTPLFMRASPVRGGLDYDGSRVSLAPGAGHGAILPDAFFDGG